MVKIIGVVLIVLLILAVLGISVSAAYHRYQLAGEAREYPPPGKMVEVHGQQLHVYTDGEGEKTMVFLAGHGTSNPTLDFKPLWQQLSDEYQIAVVEKSGYGWSESSKSPRDLDTILEETREALTKAGVEGPYILVPHSMSGLEAIYWAQSYPEEVEAIIGLDPVTPNVVHQIPKPPKAQLYSMYLISRIGLARFMPESDFEKNFPIVSSEALTEDEKQQYLAVFYRSSLTMPMLREAEALKSNGDKVLKMEAPKEIPVLLFVSKEQDREVEGWKEALTEYIVGMDHAESIELDTGHYLHYEKADRIAEETKDFLRKLPEKP